MAEVPAQPHPQPVLRAQGTCTALGCGEPQVLCYRNDNFGLGFCIQIAFSGVVLIAALMARISVSVYITPQLPLSYFPGTKVICDSSSRKILMDYFHPT